MIYVCDAIMGTGKTSAIISYINKNPDKRFIYITPYLAEADRMIKGCNMIKFSAPNSKRSVCRSGKYSKLEDARELLSSGCNIASTHSLFKSYDMGMLQMIKEKGYVLIIDENVEVSESSDDTLTDVNMLVNSGYLLENKEDDMLSTYSVNPDKRYSGGKFDMLFKTLESKNLTKFAAKEGVLSGQYYWTLPPELISSFSDVFVLTYLFENQGLAHMFQLYGMTYKNIGITRTEEGYGFNFDKACDYIPDYVYHLDEMINIVDDPKYNSIGDRKHDLSMNWFNKEVNGKVGELKKLMRQCFEYKWESSSGDRRGGIGINSKRLWGTYSSAKNKLAAKGYTNSFLVFNSRATNGYKNAEYLIYAVNIYANVKDKKYYEKVGIQIDDDKYALSTMLQWIWRSAIRDGKPIHIYIPSRRMRELLVSWINSFKKEVNDGEQVR
jgi:hypothetical protein